jgi:type IV secretory pathway VirB10-like protein
MGSSCRVGGFMRPRQREYPMRIAILRTIIVRTGMIRITMLCALLTALAVAQEGSLVAAPAAPSTPSTQLVIPSGTEVPVALKHAISTKSAREGDAVYAQTTFPIVLNQRVLVPAGTYVQGRISRTQRAGRVKGRAEVLIHFTTLIYPSGYTVLLPGAVENVPGAEKTSIKDSEGTIRQDRQTGEKVGKAAQQGVEGGMAGAVIGGLSSGSGTGAGVGAGIGGLTGIAIAMLTRGADVRLDAGTTVQMVIQRDVPLDPTRITAAK